VIRMDVAGLTQLVFKLEEGKGLREGCDSKELWKSVESQKSPEHNRHVQHKVISPGSF